MMIAAAVIAALLVQDGPPALRPLTEQQVSDAIERGRLGDVPLVQVGTFIGVTKGDFNVFFEGPVTRIASAAHTAIEQLRPFDLNNVTNAMRAPMYRVVVKAENGRSGSLQHIVLQAKGRNGMDGVQQPVKEGSPFGSAYFDRLPDGEFDVVVVTTSGNQRYDVSSKDRQKIEAAAGIPTAPFFSNAPPSRPVTLPSRTEEDAQRVLLRLLIQGDGKHISDAIQVLQAELRAAPIAVTFVRRGEPYDYTIIFGEGDRNAATAIALDKDSNIVAVAVKGAFTEKGAAEGVGRELGKRLLGLWR
jgi:hypothetical protein